MPIIAPFKGLRYDLKRVGSIARVVTPPYDVISPRGQAEYYSRHPWNFVRVVFGREYSSDTGRRNRYSRAKETLEGWIRQGILKADPAPSLYPYLQEYTLAGARHRRWGVIALVRLDSPRIYPHEETREGPKRDRFRLLETVGASLSPIFGLIPDETGEYLRKTAQACRSRRPAASARLDGVRHLLWRIDDPVWLRELKRFLRGKELVIADGHHRYEAALAYRNARKADDPGYTSDAPYNFAMFYLACAGSEDPGLLPTHRLLRRFSRERLKRLLKEMSHLNLVRPTPSLPALSDRLRRMRQRGRLGIGLYTGNGAGVLLEAPPGSSYPLDVEWLHQEILPQWIGPGAEVSYTQDLALAVAQVRRGNAQALFLVQPPPLTEVFARARARLRMPGKTTYFYPKPLAGLVEYKFENLKGSDPFEGV
ncbi:MAG: DUF1015 domain-containing protein [Candidatus Omnitrophica bacterium]|nr:DUF1015 domain-containing protein [Candidatus Omnitrophota bacterium]